MCTDAEGPAPTHCPIRPGSPTNVSARPKPWDRSQTPTLSLFSCPVSYCEDLHPSPGESNEFEWYNCGLAAALSSLRTSHSSPRP